MIENMKEVYFGKFCPYCKNKDLEEYKEPCHECLETCAREDSHRPINFDPTDKFVDDAKRRGRSNR